MVGGVAEGVAYRVGAWGWVWPGKGSRSRDVRPPWGQAARGRGYGILEGMSVGVKVNEFQ